MPVFNDFSAGQRGWHAELNENFEILETIIPVPVKVDSGAFPDATLYEGALIYNQDDKGWYGSDGSTWELMFQHS